MSLSRKIHGINTTTELLENSYNAVIGILPEFLGKKIILSSGELSAKFKEATNTVLNTGFELSKYDDKSYSQINMNKVSCNSFRTIQLEVKCNFRLDERGCFYEENEVWLGDIKNGVLVSLRPSTPTFEKFNATEVNMNLKRKEELQSELSKLNSKLINFHNFYYMPL